MALSKRLTTLALGAGAVLLLKTLQRSDYSYQGKYVAITGGSRGLGLVMARQLADQGAYLTLIARDADELQRAADELRGRGATVLTIVADVRDQESIQTAIKTTVTHYGRLDVLINNAGIIAVGPVEHQQIGDFEDAMDTHFWGPLYAMFAAVPFMRQQGEGRIINIASVGGLVAVPHMLPYSASKFALVGLSDGMRAELAKDNIHVTTVCPGVMRTGSHLNALTKGQHEKEFTWFSLAMAIPGLSLDAERAAEQILEAGRRGTPQVTVSVQAKLLGTLTNLFPNQMAQVLAQSYRVLPGPTGPQGDQAQQGYESRPDLLPDAALHLADQAAEANNELLQ